jgi:HPt (histidine-containing phosphotransfer) domain-containing protein
MLGNLPPEILRLVPGYLENRKKDLETLRESARNLDFTTIKFIGHNIKGNAESYGFPSLAPIGLRMENAALAGKLEDVESCIQDLSDFLARVSG